MRKDCGAAGLAAHIRIAEWRALTPRPAATILSTLSPHVSLVKSSFVSDVHNSSRVYLQTFYVSMYRGWQARYIIWVFALCVHGAVCATGIGGKTPHRGIPLLRQVVRAEQCAVESGAASILLEHGVVQRVPVQRLRGGCGAVGGGKGLLVIDLGAQNTRAAMSAVPGGAVQGLSEEGLAILVQNDMSKLDTPTAVAFRGSKCEVGELAADQPASNVHNTIANYMPHLGIDEEALLNHIMLPSFTPVSAPPSGTASAVVTYKDQTMPVALELAVAFQIKAMLQYAVQQVSSQGGKASTPPDFQLALTGRHSRKPIQSAPFATGMHVFC